MTNQMDTIREECINRIRYLLIARSYLNDAHKLISGADKLVEQAWVGWGHKNSALFLKAKTEGFAANAYFLDMERTKINEDLLAAAQQLGFLIARDVIAPVAKESTEPVVALTGNSYMPPIRDLEDVEAVYQADDNGDIFSNLVEAIWSKLEELNVSLGEPDYDNMLYVVDTSRWQYVDHEDDNPNDDPNAWLDSAHYQAIRD